MRIAYFDCFSGASGNMILGSLVDAGLSLDALERELRRLPVNGWSLRAERVRKRGLAAVYLDVVVPGEDGHPANAQAPDHHHEGLTHRKLRDVLAIVNAAGFSKTVTAAAEKIYRRLAHAEAKVHATSADEVIFHEVGQIDAIIDIAGAVLAVDLLGIDAVHVSALPCGTGRIHSAHGAMPSPAPATLELLRDVPTYQLDSEGEFVTPTGAAILTTIGSFEPRPPMRISSIGYGSGRSDFAFPNVLRVAIGETGGQADTGESASLTAGDVVQLEANIDDMNPQLYAFVTERLFAAGALDVWSYPVNMKKGRVGMLLATLSRPERADAIAAIVLAETTTLGVRRASLRRDVVARSSETVETGLGVVQVKLVATPAGLRARPEYDDCVRIATQKQMPLLDVMRAVEHDVAEWLRRRERE